MSYLFTMAASEAEIVIAGPNGPCAVGCNTVSLVDSTRIDPLDPKQGPRQVVVSVFYPIERSDVSATMTMPYAPPLATKFLDMGLERVGLPKFTALLRLHIGTGAVRDIESIPLGMWWGWSDATVR